MATSNIEELTAAAKKLLGEGKTTEDVEWLLSIGRDNDEETQKLIDEAIDIATAPPKPAQKPSKRAIASRRNGKKGGRPKSPPPSELAERYHNEHLTNDLGYRKALHYRGAWYTFNKGWHITADGEMEKELSTWLQNDPNLQPHSRPNYVKQILANCASFNYCGLPTDIPFPCWVTDREDARNIISFANGYAVDTWAYAAALAAEKAPAAAIMSASPDLFSTDYVPYHWDPALFPARFIKYLERVQPDPESFSAIRRMIGLLLCDTGKYEVFWQLFGHGANGKTVLLDIIEALVGRANVSRVGIEALAPGTRFQTFPLATAKVNICGELATDLGRTAYAAIEGQLKHAVSGGTIEIERKGIDKTDARCRARFIMSGNSLPSFFDRSDAIWRRLRIIPFTVQIPENERDPDLAASIIADELPGICAWALEGLAEIIASNQVPDCPAGQALKQRHRLNCDHERQFLTDTYAEAPLDRHIAGADIYEEYTDWVSNSGYRALGKAKFFARVEDVFPHTTYKQYRIGDERLRGFAGLRKLA